MKKNFYSGIFIVFISSFYAKGMDCGEDVVPCRQTLYLPVLLNAQMTIDPCGRDLVVHRYTPEESSSLATVELTLSLVHIKRGYTKLNLKIPDGMQAEVSVPTTLRLTLIGDTSKVELQASEE
jgi:hypothetical protein